MRARAIPHTARRTWSAAVQLGPDDPSGRGRAPGKTCGCGYGSYESPAQVTALRGDRPTHRLETFAGWAAGADVFDFYPGTSRPTCWTKLVAKRQRAAAAAALVHSQTSWSCARLEFLRLAVPLYAEIPKRRLTRCLPRSCIAVPLVVKAVPRRLRRGARVIDDPSPLFHAL